MRSVQIDIGGTWTRIRTPNGVEKVPSPSALHRQNASHDQLVRELIHLLANHAPRNSIAYVSLGAAYDQETDIAYGSAPLWGPGRWDVPMRRLLEAVRPDVYWSIVNDVSAGLAHFIDKYARPADRYVTYLTISSGIALSMCQHAASRLMLKGCKVKSVIFLRRHLHLKRSGPSNVIVDAEVILLQYLLGLQSLE